MNRYKLIFIDIDNTLLSFDLLVQSFLKIYCEKWCVQYDFDMFETFERENNILWKNLEKGLTDFETIKRTRWNIVLKKLGIEDDGIRIESEFREFVYDCAIPVEGAVSFLKEASQAYILCSASNGPYLQQIHRLDIAGMKQYIKYHFISENVGYSKPDRRFFEYAFRKINSEEPAIILPSDSIMIGDSMTSDIQGGVLYGIDTCLYVNRIDESEKYDWKPSYVADNFTEILSILQL